MHIAATVTAVLAIALTAVGVFADTSTEPTIDSLDGGGSSQAQVLNWTVVEIVDHSFRLDFTQDHTFDVTVPEGAGGMFLEVEPTGGVYQGPVTWTGLEGCDAQTGAVGPTVDPVGGNGFTAVQCHLASGTYSVTFSVPAGVVDLQVGAFVALPVA